MLSISLKSREGRFAWYVTSKTIPIAYKEIRDIEYIEISEEELNFVKTMFTGYPCPWIPRGKKVFIYDGPAKTIVANLHSRN